MKNILDLIGQFAEMSSITADQKENLEKAFAALPESDITPELKEACEECLAKFEEDDNTSNDDSAEEDLDTSKEKSAEKIDASEDDLSSEASAKDDEEVTIKASELSAYKQMAKQTARLVRQTRKEMLERKVNGLAFSEANPKGLILPKSQNKFVEFALSLSETQADNFLGLISGLQKLSASEVGHNQEGDEVPDPEKIKFLMKSLQFTEEEAKNAFKIFKEVDSKFLA